MVAGRSAGETKRGEGLFFSWRAKMGGAKLGSFAAQSRFSSHFQRYPRNLRSYYGKYCGYTIPPRRERKGSKRDGERAEGQTAALRSLPASPFPANAPSPTNPTPPRLQGDASFAETKAVWRRFLRGAAPPKSPGESRECGPPSRLPISARFRPVPNIVPP